ncbi:MAG TPA: N-acetylmuramoyl-L-alanine amidase [Gemmatimonadales bacterium]|nr:N-acetylmuramoyl-L-alanine amidase [Gemmatimonadales bacterium]
MPAAIPAREGARSEPVAPLPAPPRVTGPLRLRVAYPAPTARIDARDSTFLYGSVGTGDATLTIDGAPVRVWPNGGWIAWVALTADSVTRFHLLARTATDSATLEYPVHRSRWQPPQGSGLWLDTLSLSPRGRVWWPRTEYLTLSARASEGADLRLRLADGTLVRLNPALEPEPVPEAVRAFDRDTAKLVMPIQRDRYIGLLRGRRIGPDPGPMLPYFGASVSAVASSAGLCATGILCPGDILPDSAWATLEAIRGGDTLRVRWPLQIALLDTTPRMVRIDDDTAATDTTDGITPGRALPAGTYHWFFPRGTRARATGRMNGDLRLALSPQSDAWVASAETAPLPFEPMTPAVVGSVLLRPDSDRVRIRIPVSRRAPFELTETEREITLRIYDAAGNVNWIRYGPADSLVRAIAWSQPATREVTLTVTLARPVWGYRARWDRNDLVLEIRRPPEIDRDHPLQGRLIAVDPGHPPAGASGPTGLREAEANLAIALALKPLLEADGARVLLTRTADVPVDLWPRVDLAERADADVLVSIHNNALPDGVNPFTNSGSSVYYNQPRSIPLARAVQDALVRRLGVRDLGIGRGDLALVRPTWMPAVLTEGLFMILPEQEAALRSTEGTRQYAEAVREGLRRFLRERAEESP